MKPTSQAQRPIFESRAFLVSVFFAILVNIYFRYTALFLSPRFWAEEGYEYFSRLHGHSLLHALTFVDFGYYNLYANISAYLAAQVPLESAPAITTSLALVGMLIPAVLILSSKAPFWCERPLRRWGALAIFLYSPHLPDVWLSSIHSQFFLGLTTFLILLEDDERNSTARRWLCRLFLLIGGLSGFLSIFLGPVYFFEWLKEKKSERAVQLAILTICALLQIYCLFFMHHTSDGAGARLHLPSWTSIAFIFATRILAAPLAGIHPANQLAAFLSALDQSGRAVAAVLVWLLALVIGVRLPRGVEPAYRSRLSLSFVSLFLLSLLGTLAGENSLLFAGDSHRYFLIPTFVFYLMTLAGLPRTLQRLSPVHWLCAAVLVIYVSCGLITSSNQIKRVQHGADWRREVEKWRKDPQSHLEVWPEWNGDRFINY
jgi:hypothetical protein